MKTKVDALTVEVQKHNNFAQRMPLVEEQIKCLNQRVDDITHIMGNFMGGK